MRHARPGESWLDPLGAFASVACGVHCLAMGMVLTASPVVWFTQRLWGLPLSTWATLEWVLAGISSLLALAAFGLGWRHHRRILPALVGLSGLALLLGVLASRLHAEARWAGVLMLLAGMLLALGHVLNLRARRSAVRPAA